MILVIKKFYIYILCNKNRNVVYVGQTSDLKKRIYFHKKKLISGFSKKYNVDRLVYYEVFSTIEEARAREIQVKKYRREKKNLLIQKLNLDWNDLCDNIEKCTND
ncbi:MAG: GIY-YIG nuclease family protein [Patescibacteria group bacterium]